MLPLTPPRRAVLHFTRGPLPRSSGAPPCSPVGERGNLGRLQETGINRSGSRRLQRKICVSSRSFIPTGSPMRSHPLRARRCRPQCGRSSGRRPAMRRAFPVAGAEFAQWAPHGQSRSPDCPSCEPIPGCGATPSPLFRIRLPACRILYRRPSPRPRARHRRAASPKRHVTAIQGA